MLPPMIYGNSAAIISTLTAAMWPLGDQKDTKGIGKSPLVTRGGLLTLAGGVKRTRVNQEGFSLGSNLDRLMSMETKDF